MRRPKPLPTPPERAADAAAPAEQASGAQRAGSRAPRAQSSTRAPGTAASAPEVQDEIETAVDLETLTAWAANGPSARTAARATKDTGGPAAAAGRNLVEPDDAAADGAADEGAGHEHADNELGENDEASDLTLRDVWRAARAKRKSLRSEVRRFTARSRRRRIIWISSVSALVLLVAGTIGAAYSPLFAVQTITVVGTSTLDAALVEDALADQHGVPLAAIDDSEIKARLVTFPMIETYAVEAHPPHELVVRIVERTPVGVVASSAGFTLVDAAGVALATTPERPEGQPLITAAGGPGSKAFTAAGLVVRSLPADIRALITGVSATTAHDVTLRMEGTNTDIVWGSAEDSVLKVLALQAAMQAEPPASVLLYDVSSPNAVVVG